MSNKPKWTPKLENLYSQLTAIEALHVVDKKEPKLNERGRRLLDNLRKIKEEANQ